MADLSDVNLTPLTVGVLGILLQEPGEIHGRGIANRLDVKSPTVYNILRRLREAGWVTDRRETEHPDHRGLPPRTLYRLTEAGRQRATIEVAADRWRRDAIRGDPFRPLAV